MANETTTTVAEKNTSTTVIYDYSLLQIAAEAMFSFAAESTALVGAGGTRVDFTPSEEELMAGNGHSSRMTKEQAAYFTQHWEVVSHQPDTATGFSGTHLQMQSGRSEHGPR